MVETDFALHPQLAADCIVVGDLPLCRVLLSRDSHYPWLILVPRREGIQEIYQLSEADQLQLARESSMLARAMAVCFNADKMNVAALGNVVPQLHLHHIARYRTDVAWPKPVWGVAPVQPYAEKELEKRLEEVSALLKTLAV